MGKIAEFQQDRFDRAGIGDGIPTCLFRGQRDRAADLAAYETRHDEGRLKSVLEEMLVVEESSLSPCQVMVDSRLPMSHGPSRGRFVQTEPLAGLERSLRIVLELSRYPQNLDGSTDRIVIGDPRAVKGQGLQRVVQKSRDRRLDFRRRHGRRDGQGLRTPGCTGAGLLGHPRSAQQEGPVEERGAIEGVADVFCGSLRLCSVFFGEGSALLPADDEHAVGALAVPKRHAQQRFRARSDEAQPYSFGAVGLGRCRCARYQILR